MRTFLLFTALLAVFAMTTAVNVHEQTTLSAEDEYIIPSYTQPSTKPVTYVHSAYTGPKAQAALLAASKPVVPAKPVVVTGTPNIIKPKIVKKLKPRKIKGDLFHDENKLVMPVTVPRNHSSFKDHEKREGEHGKPYSHRPVMTAPGTILPPPKANKRPPPPIIAHATAKANPEWLAKINATVTAQHKRHHHHKAKAAKAATAAAPVAAPGGPAASSTAAAAPAAPAPATTVPSDYDPELDPKSPKFNKSRYDWENRMRRMFGPNWKHKLIKAQKHQKRMENSERARAEAAKAEAAKRAAAAAAQKK